MGQVDLKDYSYTRSDEELVERRESAKKAKYKLLTKILKEYKNDEVAPAYSEMDLDGNGIQEIIIRTFTDQATEGGRYIYQRSMLTMMQKMLIPVMWKNFIRFLQMWQCIIIMKTR